MSHIRPKGESRKLLISAQADWRILADARQKDAWPAATVRYNQSIRRLFDQVRCGRGTWSERARTIGTALSPQGGDSVAPDQFDHLIPSDQVNLKMKKRKQNVDGIGFSAIGWNETSSVGLPRPDFTPPNGKGLNLTTVLDFSTSPPQWKFLQRWVEDDYPVQSQQHRMSADWTAPIDHFWHMCDLDNIRLQNLILPERYTKETGIYFLRPYDPEKIPVVMVHGLFSSPETFRYVINDLSAQEWFRKHYQIWLYAYPTGTPWLYNAMRFREDLAHAVKHAESRGTTRNLNQMVIISHSMGGLLARTAVTHPGTHFYDAYYRQPIDQLPVSEETRALMRKGLLYQPLRAPKRVIFMGVPHRGSPVADLQVTALLSRLIKLPSTLTIDLLETTLISLKDLQYGDQPMNKVRPPTSLTTLSPHSRAFQALQKMPLPRDVKFHSIIGDRGKGDSPDSSDGVVPYWSSSVAPVDSEKIISSHHSVPRHPDAAREVQRILREHLRDAGVTRKDD